MRVEISLKEEWYM